MTNKQNIVSKIASNGIVAAVYFIITVISSSFAFGPIQVRIAEFLILLCFFRHDYAIGITLGTFLANLSSPIPFDFIIGTLATAISCLLVSYASPRMLLSLVYPVLINAFVIGLEIFFLANESSLPWIACVGYVALGEFIAMAVGYALMMALRRNKAFMSVLDPCVHKDVMW